MMRKILVALSLTLASFTATFGIGIFSEGCSSERRAVFEAPKLGTFIPQRELKCFAVSDGGTFTVPANVNGVLYATAWGGGGGGAFGGNGWACGTNTVNPCAGGGGGGPGAPAVAVTVPIVVAGGQTLHFDWGDGGAGGNPTTLVPVSTTTTGFIQPTLNGTTGVSLSVSSLNGILAGQEIFIDGGGYYSNPSSSSFNNQITITPSPYNGSADAGNNVDSGAQVYIVGLAPTSGGTTVLSRLFSDGGVDTVLQQWAGGLPGAVGLTPNSTTAVSTGGGGAGASSLYQVFYGYPEGGTTQYPTGYYSQNIAPAGGLAIQLAGWGASLGSAGTPVAAGVGGSGKSVGGVSAQASLSVPPITWGGSGFPAHNTLGNTGLYDAVTNGNAGGPGGSGGIGGANLYVPPAGLGIVTGFCGCSAGSGGKPGENVDSITPGDGTNATDCQQLGSGGGGCGGGGGGGTTLLGGSGGGTGGRGGAGDRGNGFWCAEM